MPEVVTNARSGIVDCSHQKFAIVGAGPGRERAPFDDPTWCVQGLNEIPQPRFDRHWEMHPRSKQNAREMAYLAALAAPCYVLDPGEWSPGEIRRPVRYPLDRVLEHFNRKYFTSTFAFQVALAVLEGFEEIGIWGCGLYDGSARERFVERACLEYWIGQAEGRGVKVSEDSGLAQQAHLYGYDYDAEVEYVRAELARLEAVMRFEDEKTTLWIPVTAATWNRLSSSERATIISIVNSNRS